MSVLVGQLQRILQEVPITRPEESSQSGYLAYTVEEADAARRYGSQNWIAIEAEDLLRKAARFCPALPWRSNLRSEPRQLALISPFSPAKGRSIWSQNASEQIRKSALAFSPRSALP